MRLERPTRNEGDGPQRDVVLALGDPRGALRGDALRSVEQPAVRAHATDALHGHRGRQRGPTLALHRPHGTDARLTQD